MNTEMWGWPQFTYAALVLFSLGVALANHGKPRDPLSFPGLFVVVCIAMFILYKGGFWR